MSTKGAPQVASSLRRFAPWAVGVSIVIGLLVFVDLSEVLDAMGRADLVRYVPLSATFILVWFAIETKNLSSLLRCFGHERPLSEIGAARAYTYLLMVLNYNLGAGGVALYFRSTVGLSLSSASSLMLFYMYAETASIAAMCVLGGILLPNEPNLMTISAIAGGFLIGSVFAIAALRKFRETLPFNIGRLSILSSFIDASPKTFFAIVLGRGTYFFAFIIFFYLALPTFSVHVPFVSLLALVPTIFVIGNLPISAAGLGTIQAAMLYFFRSYGSQADIAAFSIVYTATLIVLRLPLGIFAARSHADLIFGSRKAFASPPLDLRSLDGRGDAIEISDSAIGLNHTTR